MTPSVRSRLLASGFSFALGFALANYGVLQIAKPDLWLWIVVEAVLKVGAGDGRRALGPECEGALAPVEERVHLFLHDVGAASRGALEELSVFENRRCDGAVAVGAAEAVGLAQDPLPVRPVFRQDVVRPRRSLELHVRARSSARNGFVSSSRPRVV